MPLVDSQTLITWTIRGLISMLFGVIGGFIGSWIKYYFEVKKERKLEQRELRAKLLEGVSDFVKNTRHLELELLVPPPHQDEPRAYLLHWILALAMISSLVFFFYPAWGVPFCLFVLGLSLGVRFRK